MEVVDDEGDINSSQGGCCCPGKSSREGGKKTRRNKVAIDKRKMATDGGENEKNVQGKKEERPYEGREEDVERFLEIQGTLFRGH